MIKNIIFDVGGVLLEYRWKEMLMEYGLTEEQALQLGGVIFENSIWSRKMDMGLLSIEEAISLLGTRYPAYADAIGWFLRNGEQMAVPRQEVWDKVTTLKRQGYGIYILSNYSEELFRKHTSGASFLEALDGGVVSYQVHMIKPEEGIYKALLDKYGLRAQDCIFFDDRQENVEAARRMGMQAVQVQSREMLNEQLEERINEGNDTMLYRTGGKLSYAAPQCGEEGRQRREMARCGREDRAGGDAG